MICTNLKGNKKKYFSMISKIIFIIHSYTDVEIKVINENDSEIKFNQTNYAVNITKPAATKFPVFSQFLLSVNSNLFLYFSF